MLAAALERDGGDGREITLRAGAGIDAKSLCELTSGEAPLEELKQGALLRL